MLIKKKSNSCFTQFNENILLIELTCLMFLRYLLILSGDVELNPGPKRYDGMNGRICFGHWNVNSLLAREGTKLAQIEALQSFYKF